jgi:hypothetical protein
MPSKVELRELVRERQDDAIRRLNEVLAGIRISELEPILKRIGHGGELPHWYEDLRDHHILPNLDGKTIGSVIEMLFLGVLETDTLADADCPPLRISPARGVDLPDLDLGVKSPSENYCTSEPFFSAYERLHGAEYDLFALITDYQEKKKHPPLQLRVIKWRYLHKTEVADRNLCALALKHRSWLLAEGDAQARKLFRFLAYVNQSDWRGRRLLNLLGDLPDEGSVRKRLRGLSTDFDMTNRRRLKKGYEPLLDEELTEMLKIDTVRPLWLGVLTAADNWVADVHKDFGRLPNDSEWNRLKDGPLNGKIGMSYALQWRYNFGVLVREPGLADGDDDTAP